MDNSVKNTCPEHSEHCRISRRNIGSPVATRLVLAVVFLLLLAACGSAAPTVPPPSQAQAAPTAMPARAASPTPLTSTPSPVATPVVTASPAPSAAAEALAAAFERAAALTSYRVDFTYGAAIPGGEPLLDYSAAFNGADVTFRFRMPPGTEQPGQPEVLAVTTAGGITYARGPLPIQGAEQPVWYSLGDRPPSATIPPFTLSRLVALLTERIDLAWFAEDGAEAIDGQNCTRYRGGLEAALGMLDSFGRPTTPEAIAAEATPVVERMEAQGFSFGEAEALIWVCGDGALRRVQATVNGTSPAQPGGPFTLQTGLDVTDPDGPVTIAAPVAPVAPGTVVPLATVFNGGNVRAQPTLQGEVRDQIHANETVRLLGKTADGAWYQIVNPRDTVGWVSATLLTVAPADSATVPVATP